MSEIFLIIIIFSIHLSEIFLIIIIIITTIIIIENCARICLKRGSVQSKMHVGSTFENDIKELDPRKHISI